MGIMVNFPSATSKWESLAWPAVEFLVNEYTRGLPDIGDTTHVPADLGLNVADEYQYGDVFHRAVLLDVLADCDDRLGGQLRPLLDAEADYLVSQRRSDDRGWSYFPGIPTMPPETDTLAAVMLALLRVGRREQVTEYCLPAVEFVFRECVGSRSTIPTWIVPADERGIDGALPMPWKTCLWDAPADADVMSSMLYALYRYDHQRFQDRIDHGIDYLQSAQRADGGWQSPWYCGRFYAIYVGLRLFTVARPDSPAVAKARTLLSTTPQAEGGWGRRSQGSDPLSTAFALLGLTTADDAGDPTALAQGDDAAEYLARSQQEDRAWPASDWFWRMDEVGSTPQMNPYRSRVVTTALVVKAALAWHDLTTRTAATR